MNSTQEIKCNCYTKCYCMEMSCESCGISGIIFNPSVIIHPPVCSCKTKTEQYSMSYECRCKYKCICYLNLIKLII